MRSGSSRHRGCRLSRYGHSQNFGRAAIGRFHAFASKTAKSQERFAEPTGMSRSGARRVFGADRPEALVRPPFATRVEPARDSVDPFRDVVCRIFAENRGFSWQIRQTTASKALTESRIAFSARRKGRSNQRFRMVCAEDSSRSTAARPCRFRNRSWDFVVFDANA